MLYYPANIYETIFSDNDFFLLLKLHISPLWRVGISSPNNLPHGLSSGILSKIIFNTPVKGMDKNMPEMPQTAPASKIMIMEISALIFTLEETI